MPDGVAFTPASTPEEIAAEAEAQVLGSRSATEYEGVSGGVISNLDDPTISATVGPGALAQSMGRDAAREAAKQFPNAPEPITPAQAAMFNTLDNLETQTQALHAAAAELSGVQGTGIGEYYGDLRTGQVVAGQQIPEDQRIGPFHSPQLAREALKEAITQYRRPL